MPLHRILLLAATAAAPSIAAALQCEDPISAVMTAMDCIEGADSVCATDAYADGFAKIHNGIDTNLEMTPDFWAGTFMLVDISMDYDVQENAPSPNQATLSYVETVHVTDGSSKALPRIAAASDSNMSLLTSVTSS